MKVAATGPSNFPAVASPFNKIPGSFDPKKDLVEITDNSKLPQELIGGLIDVDAPENEYSSGEQLYAAHADGENVFQVKSAALEDALRAAQRLHVGGQTGVDATAVVQSNDGKSRYLVPLGIWDPVDESMFTFDDFGGTPHDNGPKDFVRVKPREDAHVEAIVFEDGKKWVDWTGKAKPGVSSADVAQQYGDVLKAVDAWKIDTSNPRQLKMRFLSNRDGQWADRLLRNSIDGVDLIFQTKSGKPLPAGPEYYAGESEALPTYFVKRDVPGVIGASIGFGKTSIPSVTYTDNQRTADLLENVLDLDRRLDNGKRSWEIKAV